MNWYLLIKFLHIIAVTITVGGMFARQLVRGIAKKSDDVKTVAALTQVALRIDNVMVIPWSNIMAVMGVILAVMIKGPLFGFLQGAAQNWLLVYNILLVIMIVLIPAVFIPHNKKVDSILQTALSEQFGFEKMKLVRIEAVVLPEHLASARVLEKNGMQFEGLLHSYQVWRNKPCDLLMYAVINPREK